MAAIFSAVHVVTVTPSETAAGGWERNVVVLRADAAAVDGGIDAVAALGWDLTTLATATHGAHGVPTVGCALVTREDRAQVWVGGAWTRAPDVAGCRAVAVLTHAAAPAAALRAAAWLGEAAAASTGILHSRAAVLLALPVPPPGYATLLRVGAAPLLTAVGGAVNNLPSLCPDVRPLVALVATLLSAPVVAAALRALALEVPTLLHIDAAYAPLAPLLAAGLAALLAPLGYQGMFIPSPPPRLPLDDLLQAPVPVFVATTSDRVAELPPATLRTVVVIDVNADAVTLLGSETVTAAAPAPTSTGAAAGIVPGAGSRAAALLFSPFRAAAAAVSGGRAPPPAAADVHAPPPPPWPPRIAASLLSSLTLYGDRLHRGPSARAAALAAVCALPPAGAVVECAPQLHWPAVRPRGGRRTPPYLVAVTTMVPDASPAAAVPPSAAAPGAPGGGRPLALTSPVRATTRQLVAPKSSARRKGGPLSPPALPAPRIAHPDAHIPAGALLAGGDGEGSVAAAAVECVRKACMEAMAALFGDYDTYFIDADAPAAAAAAAAAAGGGSLGTSTCTADAAAAYIGLRFDTAAAVAATPDRQPFHGALLQTQAFAEFLAQRLRWTAVADAECLYFDALADAVAHRGSARCAFLTDPALAPPTRNNALAFQWQPPPPCADGDGDSSGDNDGDTDEPISTCRTYTAAFRHALRCDAPHVPSGSRRGGGRRSLFGVAAGEDGAALPVRLSLAAPAQWSVRVHRLSMLPHHGAGVGSASPPASPSTPCAGMKRRAPPTPTDATESPGGPIPPAVTPAQARSVLGLLSAGKRRAMLEATLPPASPPSVPPQPLATLSPALTGAGPVLALSMSAFTSGSGGTEAEVARLREALARSESDRRHWAAAVAASHRNMRVLVRVRPAALPAAAAPGAEDDCPRPLVHAASVMMRRGGGWQTWEFDGAIGPGGDQPEVYSHLEPTVLRCVTAGENGLILAYGQTGSGKTHTMAGAGGWGDGGSVGAGIIGRALATTFDALAGAPAAATVRLSLVEVYNEEVVDLLAPDLPHPAGCDCGALLCPSGGPAPLGAKIGIRTLGGRTGAGAGAGTGGGGAVRVVLAGVAAPVVATCAAAAALLAAGAARRATASNGINAASSRSHMLAFLVIRRALGASGPVAECKLVLGDLAGSERLAAAAAAAAAAASDGTAGVADLAGARWKESTAINLSLTALGRVMAARSAEAGGGGEAGYLPFRDSVLTHALSDCLGGNAHAALVCTLSSGAADAGETAATLAFAARARSIQCSPLAGVRAAAASHTSAPPGVLRAGESAAPSAGGAAAPVRALELEVAALRMELSRRDVRIAALEAALAAAASALPLPASMASPPAAPSAVLRSRQAAAAARLAQPKVASGSDVSGTAGAAAATEENHAAAGCAALAGLRCRPAPHEQPAALALAPTPASASLVWCVGSGGGTAVPRSAAARRRVSFMPPPSLPAPPGALTPGGV